MPRTKQQSPKVVRALEQQEKYRLAAQRRKETIESRKRAAQADDEDEFIRLAMKTEEKRCRKEQQADSMAAKEMPAEMPTEIPSVLPDLLDPLDLLDSSFGVQAAALVA